jgi:abortive infection bacteriophage resistance protein
MKFSKSALNIEDQLAKLIRMGLLVADEGMAKRQLAGIGYYRFSGYTYPFRVQPDRRRFKSGTRIEQVIRIYDFDRELRLLVNDAVERCEIAIRASFVNETALELGAHWFLDQRHFKASYPFTTVRRKMEDSVGIRFDRATNSKVYPTSHSETFISHYYTKYGDPDIPPIWMTAEMLSFGVLSRLFSCFSDQGIRREIAKPFGIHLSVFQQWLQSLSYLRNLCAHHSRLWNRVFSVPPKIAKVHRNLIAKPDRFYAFAVVVFELLKSIAPDTKWGTQLGELLDKYPEVDLAAMGFPSNWKDEVFWNLS